MSILLVSARFHCYASSDNPLGGPCDEAYQLCNASRSAMHTQIVEMSSVGFNMPMITPNKEAKYLFHNKKAVTDNHVAMPTTTK